MYNSSETSIRIKKLAKEKGIQMIELQEKCGLSKNTIMQSGKSQEGMKAKNLYAIAEMLECSVDYLLGRTDNPNTTTGNNINSVNIVNGSNGDHSPLTVNGTPEQHDTITKEFMQVFDELELSDKVKAMDHVIKLKKKESE